MAKGKEKSREKRFFVLGIVLGIFIAAVCLILFKTFFGYRSKLYFSRDEITKVHITNGNNGDVTYLSDSEIDLLYDDFKGLSFKRKREEHTSGWGYRVVFYSGDKDIDFVVISEHRWIINDKEYTVSSFADAKKVIDDIVSIEEESDNKSFGDQN